MSVTVNVRLLEERENSITILHLGSVYLYSDLDKPLLHTLLIQSQKYSYLSSNVMKWIFSFRPVEVLTGNYTQSFTTEEWDMYKSLFTTVEIREL